MKPRSILLASLAFIITSSLCAGERSVIFADDFENRSELGQNVTVSKDWPDSFKIADGILVAKQDNPDHGAVLK